MPATKHSRVGAAWPAVAATIAIASLVAAIAGQIGRWDARLDIVNDLTPLWAGAGVIGAAGWLAGRRSGESLIVALLLVAAIGDRLAAGWRGRPPARAVSAGAAPVLKIVQFNAWKENRAPRDSVSWILAQHADLVFLEEAMPDGAILAALARHYPYRQSCDDRSRCTTVLLSRVRPIAAAGLARGDPENRDTLSAAWMRVPTRCGPLDAIAVHMSRPSPWRGADRDRRDLIRAIDRLGRRRLILSGDFNSTPWSFAMAGQDAALALDRATGLSPTWPSAPWFGGLSTPPLLPLDHLYASRAFRPLAVERGPAVGSDHRPLTARIADDGCAPTAR